MQSTADRTVNAPNAGRRGADSEWAVDESNLALVAGMRHTRGALRRWRADPGPILGSWFSRALMIAAAMLFGVWLVSVEVTPDPTLVDVPGVNSDPSFFAPLARNLLVLALHATACIAGFMAGSSMPAVAQRLEGINRFVHQKAGPIAIGWVILVTGFSLVTQTYLLGFWGGSIAARIDIPSQLVVISVLPHAVLELTAVFLPMAAWLRASRRNQWEDLLAATFVTVAIAIPMLFVAAALETWIWPHTLSALSPLY